MKAKQSAIRKIDTRSILQKQEDSFSQSLWYATAPDNNNFSVFDGNQNTRVAIVGAGVTGLSAALHFVRKGVEVVLLEAEEIGYAATGRSGGFVVPDFVRHKPSDVIKELGAHWGKRMLELVGGSGNALFKLIRENRIDCEASQSGWLCPAHNRRAASSLIRRCEEWNEYGRKVEVLQNATLIEFVGTDYFDCGMHDPSGGSINPLAYARGLANVACAAGASIHINSSVSEISRFKNQWQLKTKHGILTSEMVFLCNNAPDNSLHSSLASSLIPIDVIQLATSPLDSNARKSILPHNQSLTSTNPYIFSLRFDAAGRLITGQPPIFPRPRNIDNLHEHILNRLIRVFPQLTGIRFDYTWQGTMMLNQTFLPRLVNLDQGLIAVQSCNGRALSVNTAIGAELAALINNTVPDDFPLELTPASRVPLYSLSKVIPRILFTGAKYLDKFNSIQSHYSRD